MIITFPTRPGRAYHLGLPERAGACGCDHGPLLAELGETCVRCGHHDQHTIDLTWSRQARTILHDLPEAA